jgi:UDP-N-acetyl-D-mannosaminuronate dehydrogenase
MPPSAERSKRFTRDAAVVVTDHSKVDYAAVVSAVRLVVDTRNVYGLIRTHLGEW